MGIILVVAVASSQLLYKAQVPTFGCNTPGTISELQNLKLDNKAFQALLAQKVALGDCVEFMKGSVVEASPVEVDPTVLRVQTEVDPPGYLAPSSDFKLKDAEDSTEAK